MGVENRIKPILIVGEAYGDAETKLNFPFVGASGVELLRILNEASIITLTSIDNEYIRNYYKRNDPKLLQAIWKMHPEVRCTNVFNLHPARNDIEHFCGPKAEAIPGYPALVKSKYVSTLYQSQLDRLANDVMDLDPNLVICLGNTALWALAGKTGISKLRGTTLYSTHTVLDFKLLPTYHPSAVLRQWELRPTTIADLMKAKRESFSDKIIRPEREIWIEPTLDDVERYIETYINGCDLLSVDIETSGTRITCIGFAPSAGSAIVIPFDDWRAKDGNYWPTRNAESKCWTLIRRVLADASIPKLFQNGMYDIAFLWRAYGIATYGARQDTMLLQHALQPEALKGLGYLGSIYSDEGSWKHMRKKDETVKRGA